MDAKLQIISGKFRGKKLKIPAGARPTQQRARGAVFNMLADIIDARAADGGVWDAFAGSGAMGIEFISRFGAARAVFTDTDSDAVACIRENTKSIAGCEIIIKKKSAMNGADFAIPKTGGFIAFVDSPYSAFESGEQAVADLAGRAPAGAIVVWETERGRQLQAPDCMTILKDRTYGRARFLILQKR